MNKSAITVFITALLFSVPAQAWEAYVDWQAAYSPPGGDIIAGNQIARYLIEAEPTVRYKLVQFSVLAQAYGVRGWVPPEKRGHGLDKFEGEYAWGVEDWRFAVTPRLEVGTQRFNVFIENYAPVDRHGIWDSGNAQGQETEYYWLMGVSGRVTF